MKTIIEFISMWLYFQLAALLLLLPVVLIATFCDVGSLSNFEILMLVFVSVCWYVCISLVREKQLKARKERSLV